MTLMWTRSRGIAALLFLACACKRPAWRECLARTDELEHRVSSVDWCAVGVHADVALADIPVGDGASTDWTEWILVPGNVTTRSQDGRGFGAPLVLDGSVVWYNDHRHGSDGSLEKWLADEAEADRAGDEPRPYYLLATKKTRVGLIRRVQKALRPFGVVVLAMRADSPVVEPWLPRADREAFYEKRTRNAPHGELGEYAKRIARSAFVAAEGCPDAQQLFKDTQSPEELLRGVSSAFRGCKCKGDMDTTAALVWFMALNRQVPVRTHEWSDELMQWIGDDATYADLAKAMTVRYLEHQANRPHP